MRALVGQGVSAAVVGGEHHGIEAGSCCLATHTYTLILRTIPFSLQLLFFL